MGEPKPLTKKDREAIQILYAKRFPVGNLLLQDFQNLEATVADLERQLADFVKANNEVGHRCAKLEIELAAARKRIDWWEELWEMARNADPGFHEMLRDRLEAEKT